MPSLEDIEQRGSKIQFSPDGEIPTRTLIDLHTPLTEEDLKDPEKMKKLVEQGQIIDLIGFSSGSGEYMVTVLPIPASLVSHATRPFADIDPTIVRYHAEGREYKPYQFIVSNEVGLAILQQERKTSRARRIRGTVSWMTNAVLSLVGKKKK